MLSPNAPLPNARVDRVVGLLEVLDESATELDFFQLSHRLRLPIDDLLPIIDAARLLGFVELSGDSVTLTPIGLDMARADILKRKAIFRQQVLQVPLMRQVVGLLDRQPRRRLPHKWLMRWLGADVSTFWASRTMDILVDWGRYADLIGYNARSGEVYLTAD